MDLDFVRIECDVLADSSVQLIAALNSSLRNFETEFKALCCLTSLEYCTSCHHNFECPYRIVFAQQLSADREIVQFHQKPALPFSLYIRPIDCIISPYTVGMVVVGTAVNHVELFHAALIRVVEEAVASVLAPANYKLRSFSLDYHSGRHEIMNVKTVTEYVVLLSGDYILKNTIHSDAIRLSLNSPLRLLSNGSILHHFNFAMFFRSQLRRCSSLCAYYGSGKLELDFNALSHAAQSVTVVKDGILFYTHPKMSKRLNRSGLVGVAECLGLVEPMYSLLLLGSYFNAGKGATFGAGYYHIEAIL